MANTVYDNFYLSNEIEDQYKSHLDLQTFCTVDNALEGTAGMLRKINVYKATDGTEKLAMGAGNSKSIGGRLHSSRVPHSACSEQIQVLR